MATKVDDVKEEVQQEESTEQEVVQEESPSTAESNTEELSKLTPDQYAKWRQTGELPEKKVEEKNKPTSKKPVVKDEETEEEEVEEKPKPKSRSETRKAELNEEIRSLSERRKQEEQALNDILEKKKKASEPEEKKETEEKPKPFDIKGLVAKIKARADKNEFESYEEVIAATAEALVEEKGVVSEAKLQKLLTEAMEKFRTDWVKEQEKEKEKSTIEAQRKAQETEWVKKVNDAEKIHPDYKTVCFAKDSPAARIKAGSPLDKAILKSPFGAELLYHVCSTDGEVDRINALDEDLDQPAEIKAILTKLSGEKSDEEETPKPPTTRAKKPPSEASGRSSAVTDASEAALKNKDVGAYMRAENEKEMARRKAALGAK